jgi:hypothetical protein
MQRDRAKTEKKEAKAAAKAAAKARGENPVDDDSPDRDDVAAPEPVAQEAAVED